MNIKAVINLDMPDSILANVYENDVTITFNSIKSYKDFLENPTPIPYDEEIATYTKTQKIFKKLNSNLSAVAAELRESTVQVKGLCLGNFDYKSLPDQELEIDLTNLDFNDLKELINMYPWENCKFIDQFNRVTPVSKDRLLAAYNEIDKMVETIKDCNLSPSEIAYIAFDIARSRVYKKSTSADAAVSRDLNHVLCEEEIVCAGFVNIFCSICNSLGVLAEPIYWNRYKTKDSHVSVIVYINDSKYDIHSAYAFEPTWGSKRSKDDQEYLKNSSQAFIPVVIEEKRKKRVRLHLSDVSYNNILVKLINSSKRLRRLKGLNAPSIIIDHERSLVLRYYNKVLSVIGLESNPDVDIDDPILVESVSKPINLDTFNKLILSIRDIQHSIDPSHYSNDEETINSIIKTSETYQISCRMAELLKRVLEQ